MMCSAMSVSPKSCGLFEDRSENSSKRVYNFCLWSEDNSLSVHVLSKRICTCSGSGSWGVVLLVYIVLTPTMGWKEASRVPLFICCGRSAKLRTHTGTSLCRASTKIFPTSRPVQGRYSQAPVKTTDHGSPLGY